MTLAERLINYVNDVVEGKIIAGKKHIQACQRFINDLEKLQDENYPYYFDGDELIDFYEWSKLFPHTKGILAGKRIELTDYQLFLVANIFCWKNKEDNLRRFRYVYIQIARKNAKSQLLALIASYIAFLSDEQEEVYIGAVNREQSGIVYNEILSQISAVNIFKRKYKDSYGKITHIKSGSIIQPLSKEARKTGDGKNPSVAIIDEYHAHPTDEIYEVMKTGMKARKQPLIIIITTAGFNLNSPCYREYKYVSKILDPESVQENDEYFIDICELDENDDIKDEHNWLKANPIVCSYEGGIKGIRGDLKIALEQQEKMTQFLTKNMNIWVNAKEHTYMNLKKWNECVTDKLPNLEGREVYVGLDLSATLDLTSVAFIIPIEEEKKFVVLGHSFMPEDTLAEKMATDKAPYDLWERQGWITFTEGSVVDYDYVKKYVIDTIAKYNLKSKTICYDEWNATQLSNEFQKEGFITQRVIQGMKSLAPPTRNFRELVYQKRIIHDNNPVINWAFGNAVTKIDHNLNFTLDKSKSSERIDPVACIMTAHHYASLHYQNDNKGDAINSMIDFLDNY